MVVRCGICEKVYDDTYQWTFCPHDSFEMQTLAVRGNGQSKVCHSIEELEAWLGGRTLHE